jgi:hypothetical protein
MGDSSQALMGLTFATQSVNTLASSYAQADALRTQGEAQKQQADANARIAKVKADEAISQGTKKANVVKRKAAQLRADQAIALVSSGVDVGSDVATNIFRETDELSVIDQLTVRNNAWREAWGYNVQAEQSTFQGNLAQQFGQSEARSTALTGGLTALSQGTRSVAAFTSKDRDVLPGFKRSRKLLDK